jgi:hypothetical protein
MGARLLYNPQNFRSLIDVPEGIALMYVGSVGGPLATAIADQILKVEVQVGLNNTYFEKEIIRIISRLLQMDLNGVQIPELRILESHKGVSKLIFRTFKFYWMVLCQR